MRLLLGQLVLGAVLVLGACGGNDEVPTASGSQVAGIEDTPLVFALSGAVGGGQPLAFKVASVPAHGHVELDALSGRVVYTADPDYFGSDEFTFVTVSRGLRSLPARVGITIAPVNDSPTIAVPSTVVRSAYADLTLVDLAIADVDSPRLTLSTSLDSNDIISTDLDPATRSLVVRSLRRGVARVTVTVQDDEFTVTKDFDFVVGDARKSLEVPISQPSEQAVKIRNTLDRELVFKLEHNGFPSFSSLGEVVEYVERMASVYPQEPFPSKLWRFVRDSTIHDYPISQESWFYDPLVTLNSTGWGLCSNVASLFMRISRAAGYSARVWGLEGHVVPEVRVDGRWQMFDPDLSVFYRDESGQPIGVETLMARPELISNPIQPIHNIAAYDLPYNQVVAEIYGTIADNAVTTAYDGPVDLLDGTVRLPAGATLTYPGRWRTQVLGFDGFLGYPVQDVRQASLELPSGFTGTVAIPWMLLGIEGDGKVMILGNEYTVGSEELDVFLKSPLVFFKEVTIVSNGSASVRLIFSLNAVRFELQSASSVALTGFDVWGLTVEPVTLEPAHRVAIRASTGSSKPRSNFE